MNRQKKYLWLFFIWVLVILIFTGIPGNYVPATVGIFALFAPDKIIHILLFLPLSFLWLKYRYNAESQLFIKTSNYFIVIILGTIYGMLTELLQFYVFIGRSGNYYDFFADIFGVLLGVLLFNGFLKAKNFKRKI